MSLEYKNACFSLCIIFLSRMFSSNYLSSHQNIFNQNLSEINEISLETILNILLLSLKDKYYYVP